MFKLFQPKADLRPTFEWKWADERFVKRYVTLTDIHAVVKLRQSLKSTYDKESGLRSAITQFCQKIVDQRWDSLNEYQLDILRKSEIYSAEDCYDIAIESNQSQFDYYDYDPKNAKLAKPVGPSHYFDGETT